MAACYNRLFFIPPLMMYLHQNQYDGEVCLTIILTLV